MSTTHDLTQRHRAQQLLLRRTTVNQMAQLWPMLDWANLDATYPRFVVSVARVVQQNRQTSSGLAASYLRAFRTASGVPGQVKAVFAAPAPPAQLGASIAATSIAPIKAATGRGVVEAVAMSNALTMVQGAAVALVLGAMRETILGSLAEDPAAIGWQRVLGGDGCDFCAMLADRGAVYKEDTADFAAHDHCGCSATPAYGDELKTVKAYTPSERTITDRDRARVRAWLNDHPRA